MTTTTTSAATTTDDFAAVATLAALRGVTADQMPLLDIITDPVNEGTSETRLDLFTILEDEVGAFEGTDAFWTAKTLAMRLDNHYARLYNTVEVGDSAGLLDFSYRCDSDGMIDAFTVGVYLGHEIDAYLSKSYAPSRLTPDRDATGVLAALHYVQSIDFYYRDLRDRAIASGHLRPLPA